MKLSNFQFAFMSSNPSPLARARELNNAHTPAGATFVPNTHLLQRASAYRTPVPWQRWHFTTLSPFLTKPLPSQFLHLAFFLTFGPFSLAMTVTKVRFVRWIATEGFVLSVYSRDTQWHSA